MSRVCTILAVAITSLDFQVGHAGAVQHPAGHVSVRLLELGLIVLVAAVVFAIAARRGRIGVAVFLLAVTILPLIVILVVIVVVVIGLWLTWNAKEKMKGCK